jgi:hypothetical protein
MEFSTDDIIKAFSGGGGSKADTIKAIKDASAKIAGSSAGTASNSAAGFLNYSSSSSGGERTAVDLERLTADPANKTPQEVGTTVNEGSGDKFKGFGSFLNPYYLVRYHAKNKSDENSKEYINNLGVAEGSIEYKGLADAEQYKNPSTSLIIAHFDSSDGIDKSPEKIYRYADFLYLKHYHPFNNNRLITLRRFMAPVYDQLRIAIRDAKSNLRRPIAQALSYLDTSSNSFKALSKMNVTINTKLTTGALDNVTTLSQAEKQLGESGNSVANIGIKLLSLLSGKNDTDKESNGQTPFENWTSTYDPWKNGPLQDLVYGPVNVITGSLIRDRGLKFRQDGLKVNFEYSSKSIEHINQKAAMLDILSNMLALTYNHALFWGGENRFLIDRENFPLVRAEVMFGLLKNLKDPIKGFQDIENELGLATSNFKKNLSQLFTDSAKDYQAETQKLLAEQNQKAADDAKLNDPTTTDNDKKAILSSRANKAAQLAAQLALGDNKTLQKLQRQILEGTKAELTGAPTGEWHLQVGNPFAPMMMIGNLWCTSTDFEFNDELSIDDFPTELKVSCTLTAGRQRDASDIQSMFNGGGGRIYYPYADAQIDANASYGTTAQQGTVKIKDSDLPGAFNKVNLDRNAQKITDAVTLKTETNKGDNSKVARAIFKPLNRAIP